MRLSSGDGLGVFARPLLLFQLCQTWTLFQRPVRATDVDVVQNPHQRPRICTSQPPTCPRGDDYGMLSNPQMIDNTQKAGDLTERINELVHFDMALSNPCLRERQTIRQRYQDRSDRTSFSPSLLKRAVVR